MRTNRPIIGFIIGLLMPLVGFLIVFAVLGRSSGFSAFTNYLLAYPKELAKVISLSILANLLPFILFNNRRLDYAARGVFIATMLYAILIVLLRFIW